MRKIHTYEDKIAAVRQVLDARRSIRSVALEYHMDAKTLTLYKNRVQQFGEDNLRDDVRNPEYPLELKEEIVRKLESGSTVGQLSTIYGIPAHSIRRWRAKGSGALADGRKKNGAKRGLYSELQSSGLFRLFLDGNPDRRILEKLLAEIPQDAHHDRALIQSKLQ